MGEALPKVDRAFLSVLVRGAEKTFRQRGEALLRGRNFGKSRCDGASTLPSSDFSRRMLEDREHGRMGNQLAIWP